MDEEEVETFLIKGAWSETTPPSGCLGTLGDEDRSQVR